MNWRNIKLGEVLKIKHGYAFKGKYFGDKGKYIVLTPGNFRESGGLKLKGDKEKYYLGDFPKEYILHKGDLLVVMTDLTQECRILGSAAFIDADDVYLHNQRLGKIVDIKTELVMKEFVYYLFNSKSVRTQLINSSSGTTVHHTSPDRIYEVEVQIPPIKIQEKIVSILKSIDDKIQLNRQMNETLEEMAMTLYKHWFVDFGPFQDGEFVESELGMIPKGWEVSSLKEFANILMGQSPKSEFYNQERKGLPFHQGVKDFGARFPVHTVYCTQELRITNKGDILLSVRAPVGRINIANNKLVIGRGLSALHSKSGHNSFLLYTLKRIFAFEDQYGSGTVFNSINKKDIEQLKFIQPPQEVLDNFENHVSKFDALIEGNTKEIEELQELRDYLLPRLLSGEIDLSQAEKQVEEVL